MTKQKTKGEPKGNKNVAEKEPDYSLWDNLAKNYEMVDGAQISNSFIALLTLSEVGQAMSTTELSEYIAKASRGQLFKLGATLRETLENRLRPAGYVEGVDVPNEHGGVKPIRKTNYRITAKGEKLLKGWKAFIHVVS